MKMFVLFFIIHFAFSGCSQNRSLGYEFDLFKNTPNWKLAKAIENEDVDQIVTILKDVNVKINLQEPKYGQTLLMLAVGNDKLKSVKILLEHGAEQNILDSLKKAPIHEVTDLSMEKKHRVEILNLLLQYGANPNNLLVRYDRKGDTMPYITTPLKNAIGDLACTKVLLEHGADIYLKIRKNYSVWSDLLVLDSKIHQNIFVAKYIIVDMQLLVPNPLSYHPLTNEPINALFLLEKHRVYNDPEKQKAKDAILDYLQKIDFPNNGVYKSK